MGGDCAAAFDADSLAPKADVDMGEMLECVNKIPEGFVKTPSGLVADTDTAKSEEESTKIKAALGDGEAGQQQEFNDLTNEADANTEKVKSVVQQMAEKWGNTKETRKLAENELQDSAADALAKYRNKKKEPHAIVGAKTEGRLSVQEQIAKINAKEEAKKK